MIPHLKLNKMARYTGPKSKIARRFKDPIFGPDKALEKKLWSRTTWTKQKTRKAIRICNPAWRKTKSKIYIWYIGKTILESMFKKASRMKGITGENLLQLCESRLDNMVFRLGISLLDAVLDNSFRINTLLLMEKL